MVSTTTTLPVPVASPDVLAFAKEQGVLAYLPAMLEATRRVFPAWPIKVFLEEDHEIANDWYIVLEVQVPEDATVDHLVACQQHWSSGIFQVCPSTHVHVFRFGMA